jgi:thiosulfate/3-mercaptopyruvate sulfurtransferase
MLFLTALVAISALGLPSVGIAASPLVDAGWLRANLGKPEIVVVDLRPSHSVYLTGHIPGAVYTDYTRGGWREKDRNGVEGMLPPADKLEKLIGGLGIGNSSHVVLVPAGTNAADMATATRVYWTFKVLGHDEISILDGGFLAWIRDLDSTKRPVNPLETNDVKPSAKTFVAKLRQDMIVTKEDVQKAIKEGIPLVDNRPPDFFVGLSKSPAAKRAGTLPGARSLPESWLTENNGGYFRNPAQLAKLYQTAGVPSAGAQVNFCNTGHWASLGWFVASELMGNKSARMYDGSMAEWTQDASLPVERKITVD